MLFSKMHGLCNDFVIVDCVKQKNLFFSPKIIQNLANRNTGIGFDQLLIVEPSNPNHKCDFNYRIFNANGKEVEQCGNGARCIAIFLYLKGLIKKRKIKIHTKKGYIFLNIKKNNFVCVNMGIPKFHPKDIPFYSKTNKIKNFYKIKLKNYKQIFFNVVSLGNPHCVIKVNKINNDEIKTIGPLIEKHKKFPEGVNVGFLEKINKNKINLRVYERGVGETKACGSGACAAVAVGIRKGILSNNVSVNLLGGVLNIFWKGLGHPIFMTGPATYIYDGNINIFKNQKS